MIPLVSDAIFDPIHSESPAYTMTLRLTVHNSHVNKAMKLSSEAQKIFMYVRKLHLCNILNQASKPKLLSNLEGVQFFHQTPSLCVNAYGLTLLARSLRFFYAHSRGIRNTFLRQIANIPPSLLSPL
jgi:hypothetical protein